MIKIGICGLLGYEAAEKLLEKHTEELENHFSRRFLADFRVLAISSSAGQVLPEQTQTVDATYLPGNMSPNAAMQEETLCRIFPIGKGGLFGALWEVCEKIRVVGSKECNQPGASMTGCRVDLLKVPVCQEIVEICELYDETPYETPSRDCFLIVWDEERQEKLPEDYLRIIEKSVMIGRLTTDHKRILINGENIRYLTPPARQLKDIRNRIK